MRPRPARTAGSLLAGAVLTASATIGAVPAHAAAPSATAAAAPKHCVSKANPKQAQRISDAIRSALSGRSGTESVAVLDRKRGISCSVGGTRRYDSASVVKATILAATLRRAIEKGRGLTANEKSLAHKMITRSDNGAASSLWRSLGRTRMQKFLNMAGMKSTKLGPDGYWGLTQITTGDQIKLLSLLTKGNKVLTDRARDYQLTLMNSVVPAQRWGTPAGRPTGVKWHVKNGWLPRHGKHWRVHSIGAFTGRGENYMIVVLTRDTPSMGYAVTTIERVASAVHRNLNPGLRSQSFQSTPNPTWETSDGSVPPNV
ncbi:serine hydrolase [Actinomadura kijaniata]|uniref:Beta-lactamase class A catalytic domain-containing protein n=1 Tax=Actinomadura namibiensis TaxID=182080 RepID=A0A7W3LLZ8_ACTNM|nr:serine hydrolase [Actinomadura namibiensis]MBA8950587.1 hypothetical protein [Actinomadura namibiensis]